MDGVAAAQWSLGWVGWGMGGVGDSWGGSVELGRIVAAEYLRTGWLGWWAVSGWLGGWVGGWMGGIVVGGVGVCVWVSEWVELVWGSGGHGSIGLRRHG